MADSTSDADAKPPQRRPRAPTITIDTTAVSPGAASADNEGAPAPSAGQMLASSAAEGLSPSSSADQMEGSGTGPLHKVPSGQRPEIQAVRSGEGKDSRPTSPHNVSSPVTFRGNSSNPAGFLSVPSNLRSRQNSVDSEEGSRSFTSSQGDTMVSSTANDKAGPSSASHASENERIMHDPDALKADQGRESEFQVQNNPFAFSPGMLNKMFNPKSLAAFYKMGGLAGIEKGLRTDRRTGLSVDETSLDGAVSFEDAVGRTDKKLLTEGVEASSRPSTGSPDRHTTSNHEAFSERKRVYRDNRLPEKKGKSFLQLVWITYNDKVLILLSAAAVVSLGIGLYQTFGTPHDQAHPPVEWIEGVAIIVAIFIVVLVGSLNDYQKERQFAKLNRKKQDRLVKAVRSGQTIELSVYDILAGDVLHLEPGDMIPVDGLLIQGFNVKCDESQATGESDIIKKRSGDEVYAAIENHDDLKKMDPFIQSGARVMEGVGTYLVTSTGIYSTYGQTLMSLNEDPEITPLQSKLNIIAEYIAKLGGAAGLLLFIVLFIKFLVRISREPDVPAYVKAQQFLRIFIQVVTIIVVAVPEGLPLAVTLALAFATTRMLRDNNLVRHLKACEVMGNATTICSDKTGTLTQNKMQVVAGTIGSSHRFGDVSKGMEQTPNSPTQKEISAQEVVSALAPDVKNLLLKSISLNSTAFEGDLDGQKTFIGSKTETALLIFAKEHLAMGPVSQERDNAKSLQLFPFDSGRKCMGILVQLDNGKARLYVKGASEIMLEKCTQILRDPSHDLATAPMTEENRKSIEEVINKYASKSLRTIGLTYRDFERWPPRRGVRRVDGDKDEIVFEDICQRMVFAGVVGIMDPLRQGVQQAVKDCQRAGVVVRMVTGDNRVTAEAIARDCGIFQPNTIVMEGPKFRNLSKRQQEEVIPRLHVLARSSPDDKRILVKRLKERGETVAVTGDGTNDAPALKMADIGFSMGIAGTEVAKEASAIILMDDNFNSIVKALKWGRAVNDAVKKFLQFQLTVNVTAVVLTFVSAVSSWDEESVLTAVQLLWVNLIMDTLAALALATDPPQESILDRKPERKGSSIISTTMWKMILGQALYQLLITFLIYFGKANILPAYDPVVEDSEIQTLVFNTFVWMQIFNQWNNRRLDNHFNIFEGLLKNPFFIVISALMVGGQCLIVLVGSLAFNISPLGQTPAMWGYAIVLGFLSIPVGMVIRLIPDRLLERLIPDYLKRKAHHKVPGLTVNDEERFDFYPTPLADVRDELAFLKRIKGGRLSNLKFAMTNPREALMQKTRSPSHSREHSRANSISIKIPQTPTRDDSISSHSNIQTPDGRKRSRSMRSRSNSALGAATVMTGIVAGSIAAGWMPTERRGEGDAEGGQAPPRSSLGGSMTRSDSHPQQMPTVLGEQEYTDEPQDIGGGEAKGHGMGVPALNTPGGPSDDKKSIS